MGNQVSKLGGNNAVRQVGDLMKNGQENQVGLVGTLALGAIAVVGLAIKTIGDMSKK